ncbi:MAG: GGDEF domain-containing protein [Treponema sp.]|jgi:diguanylate cyclase (GGDEF)-like protein|nr:GGDEF domain-containing protein [Treponema sp.]
MNTAAPFLNTAVGPVLIFLLIIFDYVLKYNTNAFQRRLFIGMLAAALAASLMSFLQHCLSGIPGRTVTVLLHAVLSLFLITQNITYYLAVVFIDYFACLSVSRTRRILKIFALLFVLYLIAILLNLKFHFFFSLSADNFYYPAAYPLRLAISYITLALIIIDIFISGKYLKPIQIYLLSFFCVLAALGASLDVFFQDINLSWPCFAAGVLYVYFFIIQSDSKIDSLTGIGNRMSFNELFEKLARSGSGELYSLVMIDMDHFKEINDTLGHLEGDNALRDMAAIIKGCIRESDFAARYGGDEFILVIKGQNDIAALMKRIEQAVQNQNKKGKRPYKLQWSYGWDNYSAGGGRSIKEFLAHIDALMYQQKSAKREREKRGKADV